MTDVEATETFGTPPRWATLQRDLLAEAADAIDPVLDAYTDDDGRMLWPPADDYVGMDAVDDAYESFHNWPLCYVLGGADVLFERALEQWETITEQFSAVPTGAGRPQIVREYQQGHDWFHQSEGNLLFYHLCLADPTRDRLRDLAKRFAGFYLNEHPGVAPNVDRDGSIVYCPMNGSSGPAYHNFSTDIPQAMYKAHSETRIPWEYEPWKEGYGLPFYDLDGIDAVADLRDETKARRMGEAIRDRCARSETPQNLGITSLLANAFLLTGAEPYRSWVVEYVDAWIERAARNGGLLPDNVDHDDEIGGNFPGDGRWFGGWYGWTWPHGLRSLAPAFTAGAENALLLTGDRSYLEFPRSQFDRLERLGRDVDGTTEVPYRYGHRGEYPRDSGQDPDAERGWFAYAPAPAESLSHLWLASGSDRDADRLVRARERSPSELREDPLENWLKDFGGNEHAWHLYLSGEYPDYPEAVLRKDLAHVRDRLAEVGTDDQPREEYDDYYFAKRNPVATEALVQLTTGAPQEIFNGGLPVSTIRHFDPDRERPGLPTDVAALVSSLDGRELAFELANVGDERREVVVQAGGFAEHRFTQVRAAGQRCRSDSVTVDVALEPRTNIEIEASMERFVNAPTYAFPWHAAHPGEASTDHARTNADR